MSIEKHVDYWRNSIEEDLVAAESLIDDGRFYHGLFLAHLAIEKVLMALVARKTGKLPRCSDNLIRLTEMAELETDTSRLEILQRFSTYQLMVLYPDHPRTELHFQTAYEELESAREMIEWLTAQL